MDLCMSTFPRQANAKGSTLMLLNTMENIGAVTVTPLHCKSPPCQSSEENNVQCAVMSQIWLHNDFYWSNNTAA